MQGKPAAAEPSVTLHQPEARRVFSRASCHWISGPWQWRAAQATRRGGVESGLCSHTGFLMAAAAALVSLVSTLIATAHTHLWILFRRCSESPLLTDPETMASCLLGRSRLFPRLPPGQLWLTSPLQAVFSPPTPVLSLGSDLQSLSLNSQPPLILAGEQTSLQGW